MSRFRAISRIGCALAAGVVCATPAFAAHWEPGFYGPGGYWHPGHWVGGPGGPPPEDVRPPPGYAAGRVWVRGFYGPGGYWHPGHWAP